MVFDFKEILHVIRIIICVCVLCYFNNFTYTNICELLQSHTSTRWLWHCLCVPNSCVGQLSKQKPSNLSSRGSSCHAGRARHTQGTADTGILEFLHRTGMQRLPAAQAKGCSRCFSSTHTVKYLQLTASIDLE